MASQLNDMNLSKLWVIVKDKEAWYAASIGSQRAGHDLANGKQHQMFFIGLISGIEIGRFLMVCLCLSLYEATRPFLKLVALFYTSTGRAWGL